MAQWVNMEAEKITHWPHVDAWPPYLRLIRDHWFVGPQPESQKSMRETRDNYFLTPSCLSIEPLWVITSHYKLLHIFWSNKNPDSFDFSTTLLPLFLYTQTSIKKQFCCVYLKESLFLNIHAVSICPGCVVQLFRKLELYVFWRTIAIVNIIWTWGGIGGIFQRELFFRFIT